MQRTRHNFFFFSLTSSLTAFISPCKKTRRCVPSGRWKRKRRSSSGSEYRGWEQEGGDAEPGPAPPLTVLSLYPGLTGPLLLGSYTRDHPLFLQLKDYFWVKTPSLYELPYGTKGSGKPRQRSPWVSVHPSVRPAAAPQGFQLPSY